MSVLQQVPKELLNVAPARHGRHDFRFALCILAAAFVFYLFLWPEAPQLSLDSPSYLRLARDIRAGHLSELSIRTPGFPLFLLVMGSENNPTRSLYYVQLLLYFTSAGLLAALLRMLQLDRRYILGFVLFSVLPVCQPSPIFYHQSFKENEAHDVRSGPKDR